MSITHFLHNGKADTFTFMEGKIYQHRISGKTQQIIYLMLLVLCGFPFMSASGALLLGLLFSILIGTPFKDRVEAWGGYLLKAAVIGLGFGINIQMLIKAGKENVGVTTAFVFGILLLGIILGYFLKIDKVITLLIAVGTAICGGTAIAAVGSAMKANSNQLSISTGTIFLLNALALFIFPVIGDWLGLSQQQFGTWAAIAIHDTSSVIGAAAKYGDQALEVASVTKMLRILWIVPVLLMLVMGFSEGKRAFRIPLFILGFIAASCLFSFVPSHEDLFNNLYLVAKKLLIVSLFLIGSGVSLHMMKHAGSKVLVMAIVLWGLVSTAAFIFVKYL